jgi:hypothetical protein
MKPLPAIEVQTAALTGSLFDASFPSPEIAVAEVRGIEGDSLCWRPQIVAVRSEREVQGLLWDFVKLADSDDQEIETFARDWGPLGFCEKDSAPMCHGSLPGFEPERRDLPDLGLVCPPHLVRKSVYSEPLARWRHHAKFARAILLLAGQLRRGEAGDPAAWHIILGREAEPEDPQLARVSLAGAFTYWQWACDLKPVIAAPASGFLQLWLASGTATPFPDEQGKMQPVTGFRGGLIGALATHLMLATAGGQGLAYCSNPDCRRLYRPRRAPAARKLHFCDACGPKAARRLAKRRKRASERQGLETGD